MWDAIWIDAHLATMACPDPYGTIERGAIGVGHINQLPEDDGVIRRIMIENAEPAEFGQLLFLIEP